MQDMGSRSPQPEVGSFTNKEHKSGYNVIVISKEETPKAGEQNTKFIGFPKSLSEMPSLLPYFLMKSTKCD